jgi:hypothetical protein
MAKKVAEPPTVESILKECAKEVKKGLGRMRLGKDARAFWVETYTATIQQQLDNGGDWTKDRVRVLPVSKKLGKVAAALTSGKVVPKWAAEAAAVAVKSDPKCPSVGEGGYCDFPT